MENKKERRREKRDYEADDVDEDEKLQYYNNPEIHYISIKIHLIFYLFL